jgi:hypothetical protein
MSSFRAVDIADWPSPPTTGPMRTYFLSSRMNAIGVCSAPLYGVRPGHLFSKMSSRQKQKTSGGRLSGIHSVLYIYEQNQPLVVL